MNADPWQREFDVAVRAVREGALLARDIRRQVGIAFLKPDQSPVTVADFAVQALVVHRLDAAFPHDPVVAEEDAAALRAPAALSTLKAVLGPVRRAVPDFESSHVLDLIDRGRAAPAKRFWTLDPVDGTQGFIRGDQYVVALALIVSGQVAIGVIGCPSLSFSDRPSTTVGWVAGAVRGRGAYSASLEEGAFGALRASSCRDPRSARVLRSFEAEHIDLTTFEAIVRELGVEDPPALMDSQAKHVVIAAGRADVLIRVPATKTFRDKIWDQAAGSLIIEEAGGRVTDLSGTPLDFSTGRLLTHNVGVVASNGLLHPAVLNAIRNVPTER